jgi:hypothetical protein
MGKQNLKEAQRLASIRQNILLHCDGIPDLIKVHGANSIGYVSLAIGKCFSWIGPTLDEYTTAQPLPGGPPLPRVTDLGERLRIIGLEYINKPAGGELDRTIETLKTQLATLSKLSKNRGGVE